jgi:hypothetical protein
MVVIGSSSKKTNVQDFTFTLSTASVAHTITYKTRLKSRSSALAKSSEFQKMLGMKPHPPPNQSVELTATRCMLTFFHD